MDKAGEVRAETLGGAGGKGGLSKKTCTSDTSVSQTLQTNRLVAMLNFLISTFTCFVVIPMVSGGSRWARQRRGRGGG